MSSTQLYQKYLEAQKTRVELENNIDTLIKKWQNKETILPTEQIETVIQKGCERLENLKRIEQNLHKEYIKLLDSEEKKRYADIHLRQTFRTSPSNISINDGVLSTNSKQSYLKGEIKTENEMELERIKMLEDVKKRVQNKEITLQEASKLVNDIKTSYDFYAKQSQHR